MKASSTTNKECFILKENMDIGIILERNWMLNEIINLNFENSRVIYSFHIDKDVYILDKDKKYIFIQANGASIVACIVEEMKRLNVRRIYRVGTCGALQNDISIGDVVLSIVAIRDEGTSGKYIAYDFPALADLELTNDLNKKLLSKNIKTHMGITWTTDGRYTESNEKILHYSKLNVKNVDMETSAFLITCWIRKIPAVSIGIVKDKPILDLDKDFKGNVDNFSKNKEIQLKTFREIISSIINY